MRASYFLVPSSRNFKRRRKNSKCRPEEAKHLSMSDFLEEKSAMPLHISPVDAPRGGENSDSEEDEPVVPAIMETSSSDDEDNLDGEDDLNQGYIQLAQDENDGLQPAEQWLANVCTH